MRNVYSFNMKSFRLDVTSSGNICAIYDLSQNKDYFATGHSAPLFRIVADGDIKIPIMMNYDGNSNIELFYGSDVKAYIKVITKQSYITFELVKIECTEVSLVIWGPYPTTIKQTIGETVGVVRDDNFALGIQALNIQTIGGIPRECPGLGTGGENHTAVETDFGSLLQAFTRDKDGGIMGSKIALFGCPKDKALETIEQIEINEGLPHPMLDGKWGKISETAKLSYLITNFGENDIEEAIAYARKAGFKYIYHEGPFQTWGHFDLSKESFPEGLKSLKRCVEKARSYGIRVGIHTLSNFITTNDPYVSPVPDPRLMRIGSSYITSDIDESSTEIFVADPTPFREQQWLSTVIIGEELIQYREITESEPWKLIGCKRGAFGTRPSSHPAGSDIGKLIDHPYNVFFPNLEMQDEMADRLIRIFNETGLQQISFDGLEGCDRTGHGIYAHNRFVKRCFDGWKVEVVNDASMLLHYLWHIHTRMNWGEPWGKAMREGMPEYRFKNQDYFNRNLFPRMLGWFQLRLASSDLEATSVDDIEWMLAKCAGYDAGFALFASLDALKKNGQTDAILKAINEWEEARLLGAFSDEQRKILRGSEYEFHLEKINDRCWQIYPVIYSPAYSLNFEERQPGQPIMSELEFSNKFAEQPLRFVLRTLKGSEQDALINPSFEIGFHRVTFPIRLQANQYLICDGRKQAQLYDINWNQIQIVEADSEMPMILEGKQNIRFYCEKASRLSIELKFKALGEPQSLNLPL